MKRGLINLAVIGILILFSNPLCWAEAKTAQELIEEGDRLYKEGRYEEAAKLYDEAYGFVGKAKPPKKDEEVSQAPAGIPPHERMDVEPLRPHAEGPALLKEGLKVPEAPRAFPLDDSISVRPVEPLVVETAPLRKGLELPEAPREFNRDIPKESGSADSLVKEADILFKRHKYEEAAVFYDKAYKAYEDIARDAALKSAQHSERLKELKSLREEVFDKREASRIKDEYIRILKERRQQDILGRRAELKAQRVLQKKTAAEAWQARRKEKERYKALRLREKERRKVEKEAILEARRILEEERKAALDAGEEAPKKKATAETEAEAIIREAKIVAEREVTRRKELAKEVKPVGRAGEKPQLTLFEKIFAKPEKRVTVAKTGRLAETKTKEEIRQDKEALMRTRLERIEETMFRKRKERELKRREELKKDAIDKASRCKRELGRYALAPDADQKRLQKSEDLITKADSYFEREMHKEAGKLYDRVYLTLKGKLH